MCLLWDRKWLQACSSEANRRETHTEFVINLNQLPSSDQPTPRRQLDRLPGMTAEWDDVARPQFRKSGERQVDPAEFNHERQGNIRDR
jgi:hypothetical protein